MIDADKHPVGAAGNSVVVVFQGRECARPPARRGACPPQSERALLSLATDGSLVPVAPAPAASDRLAWRGSDVCGLFAAVGRILRWRLLCPVLRKRPVGAWELAAEASSGCGPP